MEASPIRTISEGAPADAVPLGLGMPGWPMAEVAWRAMRGSGPCGYTSHAGLDELRDALAAAHGVGRDHVLVTCGAEGALSSLFTAWLDPGDRVLVPDPGFVAYPALAHLVGAEAIPYHLDAGNRFRLDADAVIAGIERSRPRIVVVNSPSNPTGGAADGDSLARLSRACVDRDVLLVSDEAYRELYLGEPPAGLQDVGAADGIVVGSMSKAYAAPGLRVGWMVGDPEVLHPARVVQGYQVIAPARPAQRAALALIANADEVLAASRRQLRVRWEALREAFEREFGWDPSPPDGCFYLWLELAEAAREDPLAFCLRLRDEAGVVLIPGIAFGDNGRRHARLSFAGDPDRIQEGIRRLAPYWR